MAIEVFHCGPGEHAIGLGTFLAQRIARRDIQARDLQAGQAAPAHPEAGFNPAHGVAGRMVAPTGVAIARLVPVTLTIVTVRPGACRVSAVHLSGLTSLPRLRPARAQQGEDLDDPPEQGAAESEGGMGNQAAIHVDIQIGGWKRRTTRNSEIVKQPDHQPFVVEVLIDDAENAVEDRLHFIYSRTAGSDVAKISGMYCREFSAL